MNRKTQWTVVALCLWVSATMVGHMKALAQGVPFVERRLFEPEGGPGAPKGAAATPQSGNVAVVGIVMVPNKKALVQLAPTAQQRTGKSRDVTWVSEGDTIGAFRVESIESNRLILASGGDRQVVPLYKQGKARPNPLPARAPSSAAVPQGTGAQPTPQGQGESRTSSRVEAPKEERGPVSGTADSFEKGTASDMSGVNPKPKAQPPFNPFLRAVEKFRGSDTLDSGSPYSVSTPLGGR